MAQPTVLARLAQSAEPARPRVPSPPDEFAKWAEGPYALLLPPRLFRERNGQPFFPSARSARWPPFWEPAQPELELRISVRVWLRAWRVRSAANRALYEQAFWMRQHPENSPAACVEGFSLSLWLPL